MLCCAVKALKEIGKEVGKKDWDFGVDPCSGRGNWNMSDRKSFESFVACDCSFNHSSSCHVVSMYCSLPILLISDHTKFCVQSHLSLRFFYAFKITSMAENHMESCAVRKREEDSTFFKFPLINNLHVHFRSNLFYYKRLKLP